MRVCALMAALRYTQYQRGKVVLLSLLSPSQAAIVYKNFSQPVSFTYFVPCANSGQGEMVEFSGTMQTTLAETFENGWIIAQFHIQPTMTGLGETTGITYQIVGFQTFTAKLSPTKVAPRPRRRQRSCFCRPRPSSGESVAPAFRSSS
jgi:hypothetical protein